MNKEKTLNDIKQFIKYSLVGGSNELINLIVLNLCTYLTGIYSKKSWLFLFEFIAFVLYSINGYFLNKKFTFKTQDNSYLKYASVIGVAAIFNTLFFLFLNTHNFLSLEKPIWLNISKLTSSITIGIIAFLVNKSFVFTSNKNLQKN